MMRLFLGIPVVVLLLAGCAGKPAASPRRAAAFAEAGSGGFIVSPDKTLAGKVVRVNSAARFVVLNFPIGRLPSADQRMFVYRDGLRAGEVRITGAQMDDFVIADLVKGEAAPGDEVREN